VFEHFGRPAESGLGLQCLFWQAKLGSNKVFTSGRGEGSQVDIMAKNSDVCALPESAIALPVGNWVFPYAEFNM
jgi:hypothetical protein